jgi:isoamylase
MIVDSLRYWVEEMHVDGFRFDLASILARDERGTSCPTRRCCGTSSPIPSLAGTKLIAEAWDAAGLYQVGSFIGDAGRNGTAASATTCATFFRGEPGGAALRRPPVGSPEVYGHEQREAEQSVNFVTCHDGFTLNDLVSYNEAQRGQRRGQPRRRQRQPELELRRRRPDRRSRHRGAAQPAGEELSDRHAAVARRADDS